MAIGLVVIGLIIGAIFVARDLIQASEVRSTIAQLQKYQSAVQTFRLKFNALPGDIRDPDASAFGFHSRGTCAGQSPCLGEGDGNGLIEGIYLNRANMNTGTAIGVGETANLNERLSKLITDEATTTAHTADPVTIGKHTWSREDAPAALADQLDRLPRNVRETTRVPIGTFRGLRFGLVLHPQFPPDVYVEGAITRHSTLSRDHQGPRAVLNALERLATG